MPDEAFPLADRQSSRRPIPSRGHWAESSESLATNRNNDYAHPYATRNHGGSLTNLLWVPDPPSARARVNSIRSDDTDLPRSGYTSYTDMGSKDMYELDSSSGRYSDHADLIGDPYRQDRDPFRNPPYPQPPPRRPYQTYPPQQPSPNELEESPDTNAERRQRRRRKPWWRTAPWWTYTASAIQICVFIAEFIKMGVLTGSPVQLKPSFNPMIGPSTYLLINMGGRFTPCMRDIKNVDLPNVIFPCANSTSLDTDVCNLAELCGFGLDMYNPNQWWRFITPMFLHAGIVHIVFNLILQIKLGGDLEREIGIWRYMLIYWASGIGGFVMSGNFAGDGTTTVGASGALFGVIAVDLLDLLLNWQLYKKPWINLAIHIADIVISFVLGLLPGLDNFAHIGGFAIGLLLGLAILRSPLKLRLKRPEDRRATKKFDVVKLDIRNPQKHFRNRSAAWWAWWLVRIGAVVLAVVYFVALGRNFHTGGGNCSWCKYLSCLPVHGWCDSGNLF